MNSEPDATEGPGAGTDSHGPVRLRVEKPSGARGRASAFFRPILIVPHLLLVGGPGFGCPAFWLPGTASLASTGALGAVAWLCALYDWFSILFLGVPVAGLQPCKRQYLRWRARTLAYGAFLRDEYPPFGEGNSPVTLDLPADPGRRDKMPVLLRPLLVLPHLLWLVALLFAWTFAGIFAWIWISLKASLPDAVWRFSLGVMDYSLRVEAYALLIHDTFPAFSLAMEPFQSPSDS